LPTLNIESLPQDCARPTAYELFVQEADAPFIALFANAIEQCRAFLKLTKGCR
jgi:hypothetical protein